MSRSLLLLFLSVSLLAAAGAAQESFTTEVRLAAAGDVKKLKEADLKELEAVLKRRLPILSLKEGTVEAKSFEEIRIRVPADAVTEPQLRMLVRPGVLELRHLDEVRTSRNGRGRYLIDYVQIQNDSRLRFRDVQSGRRLPPEEFLPRCPLVLSNDDLEPDTAHRVGSGLQMAVRVEFTDRAAKRLRGLTNKPGRLIGIILDGELVGMHAVAGKVGKPPKGEKGELGILDIGAGFGDEEEAGYLALVLNSGPLPVPLKVLSSGIVAE